MTSPTLPAEVRSPSTTRTNRTVLLLLGLLLLLGGLAVVLTGVGAFGSDRADQPVLTNQVTDFVARNANWFWPLVALVALLVGLLALRWLIIQGRSNQLTTLDLEADRSRGRTRLDASAFTDAITEEIESHRGVSTASARLAAGGAGVRLSLRVQLDGKVQLGEVRRRIETQVLAHAREALGAEDLPTRMELVVPRRPSGSALVAPVREPARQ